MAAYGLLVVNWPLGLGVDAAGVVVEVGSEASSKYGFAPGDQVFGCTRLGMLGYTGAQEYFLFDAAVTLRKPENISLVEAVTLGVASETACLGLFDGLNITLPDPKNLPASKDEWVIILGGASSVGKAAIQLAKAAGYKVAASCSSKSAAVVKEIGAVPFDYKQPLADQVKAVLDITDGDVARIYDAVAGNDPVLAKELFKASKSTEKLFATTNDWSGIGDFEGGKTYLVELGYVGRPEGAQLNKKIATYIPVITGLIEAGKLLPAEYEVIGSGGFEDAIKAYHHQLSGAGGSRKVVVKIQDE
jgi:NADPH:quinone reductase-like Zn-dependent oxidoreductase